MPELADFAGLWTVTREIDDDLHGGVVRFTGVARFIEQASGLDYLETGQLHLDGARPAAAPLRAERRYLWRQAAPGRIAVCYADGRAFHQFSATGISEAVHDCAPDTYRVCYDFRRWPEWQADWTVSGPRKSYRMRTLYQRQQGD